MAGHSTFARWPPAPAPRREEHRSYVRGLTGRTGWLSTGRLVRRSGPDERRNLLLRRYSISEAGA
jgi:hypothetical protein